MSQNEKWAHRKRCALSSKRTPKRMFQSAPKFTRSCGDLTIVTKVNIVCHPIWRGCNLRKFLVSKWFRIHVGAFDSAIRRRPACPPSWSDTRIKVGLPSTVISISASQGGKSTDSTGIAKPWASCASGMHIPAARSSKVTTAEWLVTDAIMVNPRTELAVKGLEYCRRHDCEFVADSLFGFGMHGSVFACVRPTLSRNALKVIERAEPYTVERDVYLRLRELRIDQIQGHNVPQLIDFDDELLVIEMSVVVRPFVLDFGGAYLDRAPDYDEEILEEWRRDKEEQFEENWPKAESILAELRRYGIYVADVNPGNIGFLERTESG